MPSKRKHSGDDGKTAVPGESRVAKFHPRFEVLGDLDEASAAIGLARSLAKNDRNTGILLEAQKQLYLVMADVARPIEEKERTPHLASRHLTWINTVTGELEATGTASLPIHPARRFRRECSPFPGKNHRPPC